ncbi:MAG: DUF429 domain-containing protein [Pseudomonadota bacterium]
MLGFDFPVGLPIVLGLALKVSAFGEVLQNLADGVWPNFLKPAETIDQVGPTRPFYPARNLPKGAVSRQGLSEALGAASYDDLLRRCDRASAERRATSSLFFLVGGQQVGKAAIAGWRELILRHAGDATTALWPFDGPLADLVAPGRTVLCETYPGQFTRPLGLTVGTGGRSKRRQADRQAQATALLGNAAEMDLVLEPTLRRQIKDGFGPGPQGEDAFDSLVGLLGMFLVLTGRLGEGCPWDDQDMALEGWILGHQA